MITNPKRAARAALFLKIAETRGYRDDQKEFAPLPHAHKVGSRGDRAGWGKSVDLESKKDEELQRIGLGVRQFSTGTDFAVSSAARRRN